MARSLAEYMTTVKHYEQLALNACQERDDATSKVRHDSLLAVKLAAVEMQRDEAQRELKQLQASTKHLEAQLIDGDDSSTDEEEPSQITVRITMRPLSRLLI